MKKHTFESAENGQRPRPLFTLVQVKGQTNIGSPERPFHIHMAGILALTCAELLPAESLQNVCVAKQLKWLVENGENSEVCMIDSNLIF